MERAELLDGFSGNQRSIPGKHNDMVVAIAIATAGDRFARHHQRVSGAPLFGLQHEVHARARNRLTHALRLVADDHENVLGGHDLFRGRNHVRQDRLPANFMQNFGVFRFQPRALARRHNRDSDPWALRRRIRLVVRFCHAQSIYRERHCREPDCRANASIARTLV
jgi:hypothetical protein